MHYENAKHRYFPKLSTDGVHWTPIDSSLVAVKDSTDRVLTLSLTKDTLWVAAQEVVSSADVYQWCQQQAIHQDASFKVVGKSALGRDLPHLAIGEGSPKGKPTIVVISRQHPPEVTGYFSMQAFVETLLDDTPLANAFRKRYNIWVFPLMNPDGVDLGHWRHNTGGIDLNRDWAFYHQPEVRNVAGYIVETTKVNKNEVVLGLDFHSTFYDVYYTSAAPITAQSRLPHFKDYWLQGIAAAIDGYTPRDEPSMDVRPISKNWFVRQFNAEGITYEIGDDTPRDHILHKGEVAAIEMMQLLLYRN
ncbi:MAG: M14 family metallopeptidase [Saprospiraceae bacterium]